MDARLWLSSDERAVSGNDINLCVDTANIGLKANLYKGNNIELKTDHPGVPTGIVFKNGSEDSNTIIAREF